MRARYATLLVATLLIPVSAIAAKPKLACFEDPGTMKNTCIDEANVIENGDLRASTIYSGGPKGVTSTRQLMIADCKKEITVLQDAKGVNFAGAPSNATKASRALSQWLCEAKPSKKDPKLRQF